MAGNSGAAGSAGVPRHGECARSEGQAERFDAGGRASQPGRGQEPTRPSDEICEGCPHVCDLGSECTVGLIFIEDCSHLGGDGISWRRRRSIRITGETIKPVPESIS